MLNDKYTLCFTEMQDIDSWMKMIDIVGAMIFSYHSQCLSCMAVHPNHRRKGIASALTEKMIS